MKSSKLLIDRALAGGKFHLPPAKSVAQEFGTCDDLPVTYIIVPVRSKKPGRKGHWIDWPAEG
jgi:hypothetical protein